MDSQEREYVEHCGLDLATGSCRDSSKRLAVRTDPYTDEVYPCCTDYTEDDRDVRRAAAERLVALGSHMGAFDLLHLQAKYVRPTPENQRRLTEATQLMVKMRHRVGRAMEDLDACERETGFRTEEFRGEASVEVSTGAVAMCLPLNKVADILETRLIPGLMQLEDKLAMVVVGHRPHRNTELYTGWTLAFSKTLHKFRHGATRLARRVKEHKGKVLAAAAALALPYVWSIFPMVGRMILNGPSITGTITGTWGFLQTLCGLMQQPGFLLGASAAMVTLMDTMGQTPGQYFAVLGSLANRVVTMTSRGWFSYIGMLLEKVFAGAGAGLDTIVRPIINRLVNVLPGEEEQNAGWLFWGVSVLGLFTLSQLLVKSSGIICGVVKGADFLGSSAGNATSRVGSLFGSGATAAAGAAMPPPGAQEAVAEAFGTLSSRTLDALMHTVADRVRGLGQGTQAVVGFILGNPLNLMALVAVGALVFETYTTTDIQIHFPDALVARYYDLAIDGELRPVRHPLAAHAAVAFCLARNPDNGCDPDGRNCSPEAVQACRDKTLQARKAWDARQVALTKELLDPWIPVRS